MDEQIEMLSGMIETIINNEKFIPNIARLMKKLYDELLAVGFTDEQASRIVSNYKATGN